MDAADRQLILKLLNDSREALCAATAGVSDEQAKIRPAPGRWSVLDCVEHVVFVEDAMFMLVTTRLKPAARPAEKSREQYFLENVTDRSRKLEAPDMVRPTGKFPSLAAALEHFQKSRARTIDYVEKCDLDLRAYSGLHPVAGPISGQEALIILALHPARHAAQIREVREALSLPS